MPEWIKYLTMKSVYRHSRPNKDEYLNSHKARSTFLLTVAKAEDLQDNIDRFSEVWPKSHRQNEREIINQKIIFEIYMANIGILHIE